MNQDTLKIIRILDKYFKNPEKTDRWLRIPNPLLGYVRPWDMIMKGKQKKLLKFVRTCLEENKLETNYKRSFAVY